MRRFNLLLRIVSGLLGGGLVVASIYYGPYTYLLWFGAIWSVGLYEFFKLSEKQGYQIPIVWGMLLGVLLFVLAFFVAKGSLSPIWLVGVVPYVFLLLAIKGYVKMTQKRISYRFIDIGMMLLGVVYVVGGGSMANLLVFESGHYNHETLLSVLLLVWTCDSVAYVIGRNWGKHKFVAHISPNKTWEGFLGGAIGTLLMGIVVAQLDTSLSYGQWILIAGIIVLTCTAGDITESILKRASQIKDSGSSIPGHGGVLDRFDGLLFTLAIIPVIIRLLKAT